MGDTIEPVADGLQVNDTCQVASKSFAGLLITHRVRVG